MKIQETKSLSVLGSTGSIGRQTLEVARELGISVVALAADRNVTLLEEQARQFHPQVAALRDEAAAADLRIRLADTDIRVLSGAEGVCECARLESADTVLSAVTGVTGMQPAFSAIRAHKKLAIANKEPLAAAGELLMGLARELEVPVLPVDSEHSAIFQCLNAVHRPSDVSRLILTASGGPFFGKTGEELKKITPEQALRHPTWVMGQKITIDCATLMNKGLEILEAMHLFGVSPEQIDVVIHRESIVHSLIELRDGAVLAQLGLPSMKLPIRYALTYPDREYSNEPRLSLAECGKLTFYEPDEETFLCFAACRKAARLGGIFPAAVNGANEEAVKLFLQNKLSFEAIGECVYGVLEQMPQIPRPTLEDIYEADRAAREWVLHQYNG